MQGLSRTLFERLQGKFGSTASAMLTMQYRMNTAIMQWPSHELYQDLLTAHPSVATHTLQGLQASLHIACLWASSKRTPAAVTQGSQTAPYAVQGFNASIDDVPVLLLIDTAGCDMEEQAEEDGDSKRNDGEAKVGFMSADCMSGSMTSTQTAQACMCHVTQHSAAYPEVVLPKLM